MIHTPQLDDQRGVFITGVSAAGQDPAGEIHFSRSIFRCDDPGGSELTYDRHSCAVIGAVGRAVGLNHIIETYVSSSKHCDIALWLRAAEGVG